MISLRFSFVNPAIIYVIRLIPRDYRYSGWKPPITEITPDVNIHNPSNVIIMDGNTENIVLHNYYPLAHINIDGIVFPNVEYYYQWSKFYELGQSIIMSSPDPIAAAAANQHLMIPHFDHIGVMKKGLTAKFTQNPNLGIILKETGNRPIVNIDKTDDFWGVDGRGVGRNYLGILLEQVRNTI